MMSLSYVHVNLWWAWAEYLELWDELVWEIRNSLICLSTELCTWKLAMSNQRSFKIESFRFADLVPKKIEKICFWNKILDWNKTFSISTRIIWSKSFCSGLFKKFLEQQKVLFCLQKTMAQFLTFWFRFDIIFWKYKSSVLIPEELEANKNVPN